MGFYEKQRDGVALRLITKYGLALTLVRTVKGVYDPSTLAFAADTVTTHPCVGVVENFKENMIASSLVLRGDKKLILSASGLDITPQIGDVINGMPDGTWYIPSGNDGANFKPIETVAPAGIPVIFMIQIRQ